MASSARTRAFSESDPEDVLTALAAAHEQSVRDQRVGSRYTQDQRALLRWLAGVLALGVLSWGTWVTLEIAGMKVALAVAQSRSEAIQAQLTRIEQQLTEMQRELRRNP